MFEWEMNVGRNHFSIEVEEIGVTFGILDVFEDINFTTRVATLLAEAAKNYGNGNRTAIETIRHIWADEYVFLIHVQSGGNYGIEVLEEIAKGPSPTEVPHGD